MRLYPDAQVFYSEEQVAEILPLTFDIPAAMLAAAAPDKESGGRSRNPYGQGDYLVTLIDIRRAWQRTDGSVYAIVQFLNRRGM